MNYDKVLLKIGEFGWWQKKAFLLLMVPAFVGGMVVLTTAFTAKFPAKFVCHDKCNDPQASADVDQILLDREARNITDDTNYCIMLPFRMFENNSCGMDDNQDPKKEIYCDSTSEYKFSDFGMASSVITDNKALCMNSIKVYKAICDSFFMLGYFVGGILFGMIADTFGRKISVTLAIFVSFIGSGIGPLVHHHWAYAVFRIFPGAGSIACYLMAFTLAVEVVGKKEQFYGVPWSMTIFSFIGNMIAIPFALGEASNGILAYLFPHWDSFQFSVTFICGIAGVIWFFIPESPRWLIEEKRFDEAKKLLQDAAKSNGKKLSEEDLIFDEDATSTETRTESIGSTISHWQEEEVVEGIFHPELRKSTIVLFMIWTVVSLVYYGTSFGIEELHLTSNPYLAVGIVALVEIPAYILTALVMDVTGRKPLLILTLLVTAVSCIVSAAAGGHGTLSTAMILTAKFGISSTFTVSRIYTSELYPTHMRATALGTCKTVSCFGAIAAPWVGDFLPRSWQHGMTASLIIYAACSGVAGLLSFQLADTLGFPLPSTMEDVQQIKMMQKPMFMMAGPDFDPMRTSDEDKEDIPEIITEEEAV